MSTPQPAAHERAFELIPWLANGSLAPPEREAVALHVRTCIVCRRALREQQRLQAAVRAQPTVHFSADSGLEQLDRVLDELPLPSRSRPQRLVAFKPYALAAAAGLGVMALLLWLTPLPTLPSAPYRTLATEPAAAAPLLDVVFAQDATAADIEALLEQIGGEIVAGPGAVGRYRVRLGARAATDAELTRVIETLTADSRVRLAARARTSPEP